MKSWMHDKLTCDRCGKLVHAVSMIGMSYDDEPFVSETIHTHKEDYVLCRSCSRAFKTWMRGNK